MTTEAVAQNDPSAAPTAASEPAPGEPTGDPPADPAASEAAPSTEGDPDPESVDPKSEPSPKSEAAKKGHSTRAKRAQRRAELAEDSDVQMLIDQALKKGEARAKEAAASEAKRASMTELERAQAEATDFKSQLEAKDLELSSQRGEREYGDALIESGLKVRAKSRRIFRQQVAEAMQTDDSLSHADAISLTAQEHDYLITPATTQPAVPQAGQPAPQQRRQGASTTPAPKRETAAPATTDPSKPVDVMKMSPKDYRAYRRQKHGISLPI